MNKIYFLRNDQHVSISTKTTERIHLYNRQTQRLYAGRIYARWKERFRLGTDNKQMVAKRPNEQQGLKSIYGMPTPHLISIPL